MSYKNTDNDENKNTIPFGGFPPIYICDKKTKAQNKVITREYSTSKSLVSIKDIMKNRRQDYNRNIKKNEENPIDEI
jgi:hypothetical protein